MSKRSIAIIGSGPAGLMAAEMLASAGHEVCLYDQMPSVGRKLLMAGRGGLNLTHSEPLEKFILRYGDAAEWLSPYLHAFSPEALRAWCEGLGQETFIGSSGRVFPRAMKAAPLLRAWLARLNQLGVRFAMRHRWCGWQGDALHFKNGDHDVLIQADATLLALGGASWPRLGSDGGWVEILAARGVAITPLRPSNCGFAVAWSDYFSSHFAGQPLKSVALNFGAKTHHGEMMITAHGIEGGGVYALSAPLRDAIAAQGSAVLHLDVRPSMTHEALTQKLQLPRANKSLSTYLRKVGLSPLVVALLRECVAKDELANATPAQLAEWFKSLPITLNATAGMARAISSAGGIARDAVNDNLMLRALPNVFVAGEMLDWEAPTGGYLLQGCFATAVAAAQGIKHTG